MNKSIITRESVEMFVNSNTIKNISSPMKDIAFFTWSNLCVRSTNLVNLQTLKLLEYIAAEKGDEESFFSEDYCHAVASHLTLIETVAEKLNVKMPLETRAYISELACDDPLAEDVLTKVVAVHTWRNENAIQMHAGINGAPIATLAETAKLFSHKFFHKKELDVLMYLIKMSDTSTIFDDIDFDWIKQINPRNALAVDNQGFRPKPDTIEIVPNSPCNQIFSTKIFKDRKEFIQYKYDNPEQQMYQC